MRNLLNRYPVHSFLFVFFLSLFLYRHNPEHVNLRMMYRTVVVGTLAAALLFGIFYFIYRRRIKAGVVTTVFMLLLFNYGVMYDFLEYLYYRGYWPLKNIHRYLLVISLVICVLMFFLVKRKVKEGVRLNFFLNVLLILLTSFNGVSLLLMKKSSGAPGLVARAESEFAADTSRNTPGVFYILLDGYANGHVLKKYYGYDNSGFLDFLKEKGFAIADSSFSNYYSTVPSLSSTFNLNYLDTGENSYLSRLRNNYLFSELKQQGYKIYNLQSGYSVSSWFTNNDSMIGIRTPNEFERSILKFTIFRLDDLFGVIQYNRLKSQFEKLPSLASLSRRKKFVFVHLVAPHPPYVFDEHGNHVLNSKNHDNSWEPRENYIRQLKFVNSQIAAFVSQIILSNPNDAVVIQSDHGPWIQDADPARVFEARSMILNAIRFPGKENALPNRSISSVNTFRLFFKTYFDSAYPLLPDAPAGKDRLMKSILFNDRLH
jgi:hypothetical protein